MRIIWVLVIAVAGALAGYLFTRFEGTEPEIKTRVAPSYVNEKYKHEFRISDEGTGIESIRVWLEAGGESHELASETYPGNLWFGADLNIQRNIEVVVNPTQLGIPDGAASLHCEVKDYSWGGNIARTTVPLLVDTRAPRVSVATGLTYVKRGGAELVVYSLDEPAERHGVELNESFFPGFPHPEDERRFVSLYALAHDAPASAKPKVVAYDKAGNKTSVTAAISIIERGFPSDRIRLSDGFMERKIGELLGGSSDGPVLERYLEINRGMREENNAQIAAICANASSDKLWDGAFLQLPNSKNGAEFGERRTYTYEKRTVDKQIHLGLDLASVAHAEIPAANDGVVAFTGELGIYGNTVMIDHGLGLFSLYGHLSEITIEKGSAVARGESIGRTGVTGLAGGDHLHFSTLVSGVFVNPHEWFDAKWINEHLMTKLAPEAPPEDASGT